MNERERKRHETGKWNELALFQFQCNSVRLKKGLVLGLQQVTTDAKTVSLKTVLRQFFEIQLDQNSNAYRVPSSILISDMISHTLRPNTIQLNQIVHFFIAIEHLIAIQINWYWLIEH